jgi:hypothetical protein
MSATFALGARGCSALPGKVVGGGVGEDDGHFSSSVIRGRLAGGSTVCEAELAFGLNQLIILPFLMEACFDMTTVWSLASSCNTGLLRPLRTLQNHTIFRSRIY